MGLDSLHRRMERLEQTYVPPREYGLLYISTAHLDRLSLDERNQVVACSNRGIDDEGATMQVSELTNEEIAALRPIAQRLDLFKQQKEGTL